MKLRVAKEFLRLLLCIFLRCAINNTWQREDGVGSVCEREREKEREIERQRDRERERGRLGERREIGGDGERKKEGEREKKDRKK